MIGGAPGPSPAQTSASRRPRRAPAPVLVHGVGIALCGVAAAAWYFGFAAPHMQEGETYRAARSRLSASAEAVVALERERNDLSGVLKEQEAHLASGERTLAPLSSLNAKIARITELAAKHGLRISSLSPGAPKSSSLATLVPIRITGACESADTVRFLAAMHAGFPDVAVVGFVVAAPTGDASGAGVEIDLTWYAERADDSAPLRAQVP